MNTFAPPQVFIPVPWPHGWGLGGAFSFAPGSHLEALTGADLNHRRAHFDLPRQRSVCHASRSDGILASPFNGLGIPLSEASPRMGEHVCSSQVRTTVARQFDLREAERDQLPPLKKPLV